MALGKEMMGPQGGTVAMSKHGSEDENCPSLRGDAKNVVVDAEFVEVDNDPPTNNRNFEFDNKLNLTRCQPDSTERLPPKLGILRLVAVALLLLSIFAYRTFFGTGLIPIAEERVVPPGWPDLSACSFTKSLDGTKWLTLADDQSAELRKTLVPEQRQEAGDELVSAGKWDYDAPSKKYSVTLNGETTRYALFAQEGVATCILLSGDLNNANLRESWFATADEYRGGEMPDYAERTEPH